jgi:putative ABC transport system permease protein
MMLDIRQALRSLFRSPGFTACAILILALGIGANTAIFSLVDAVLLSPLPAVGAPGELVDLRGDSLPYPVYQDLAEGSRGVARLAAWSPRSMTLAAGGEPGMIGGLVVSANYFDVLGVRPASGRFFRPADESPGEAVAVLDNGLWKSRFGADPAIVGRTIRLNGVPFTVAGVAPEGFRGTGFGVFPDVWVTIGAWPRLVTGPMAKLDLHSRNWGWLSVVGRREPGVSIRQTEASLVTLLRRDASAHGESFDAPKWSVVPSARVAAGMGQEVSPARVFGILAGAVATALLIACANLANLLLARAAGRDREIAIRQALGAGRARLMRELLTESVVLALAGGAAGLIVASWTLSVLTAAPLPGGITLSLFRPELGARTLIFALGLSAATGIAFGLLPALQASRVAISSALKLSAATLVPRSRAKGILVGTQIALCLALLATAGLLARSLSNALAIDLGFRPSGVTLAHVNLGLGRYDGARAATFVEELPRRLGSRTGVKAAGWTSNVPLSGDRSIETFDAEGYVPPDGRRPVVNAEVVSPGYFGALAIPMAAGRDFGPEDRADAPAAALVNEAFARRYWPGASPIGRRLTIDVPRTVVGVVRDFRFGGLSDPVEPQAFAPIAQISGAALSGMTLAVRTDASSAAAAELIRAEIRRLDGSLPISGIRPFEEVVAARLLPQRAGAALLVLFGALSLLLAAFGIYAVVSWSARRQTREVGIRMAIGAQAADVRALVLRQTAAPLAGGLAAGIALAALAARLIAGALYGVGPEDPVTFAAATILLAGCAFLAAYLPARRASRIDPMTALRSE